MTHFYLQVSHGIIDLSFLERPPDIWSLFLFSNVCCFKLIHITQTLVTKNNTTIKLIPFGKIYYVTTSIWHTFMGWDNKCLISWAIPTSRSTKWTAVFELLLLEAVPLDFWRHMGFKLNGAPFHFSREVTQFLIIF